MEPLRSSIPTPVTTGIKSEMQEIHVTNLVEKL